MLQSGTELNWMLWENFIVTPASAASSLRRSFAVPLSQWSSFLCASDFPVVPG